MKVLFHINSLGKGGAEHVVVVLMAHMIKDGIEVVLATEWEDKDEYSLPERVIRIPVGLSEQEVGCSRLYRMKERVKKLKEAIRREKPDIVISFMQKANYRAAAALWGTNIPLVVSVRNDPRTEYVGIRHFIPNLLLQMRANGCVFQTIEAQSFFHGRLKKKSIVLWNPLDEKYLNTQRDWTVYRHGKGENFPIVTVGRINSQKNQLMLIKAFHRVLLRIEAQKDSEENTIVQNLPEYFLHIYGGDSGDGSFEKMQAYIRENHLEKKVVFRGVSNALERDLEGAGLFVLPSDYEGMPNALIEAMAMGIPCIATDCPCGGPRMAIRDCENGRLVPIKDEEKLAAVMEELLLQPEVLEQMGKNATQIREEVKSSIVYEKWKEYIAKKI